jgi:hypothetical protein
VIARAICVVFGGRLKSTGGASLTSKQRAQATSGSPSQQHHTPQKPIQIQKLKFKIQISYFKKKTKVLEAMWDESVALTLTPQAFSNINPNADIFNNINQQFWCGRCCCGGVGVLFFGCPRSLYLRARVRLMGGCLFCSQPASVSQSQIKNTPPPLISKSNPNPQQHQTKRNQKGVCAPRLRRVGLRGVHRHQLLPARARARGRGLVPRVHHHRGCVFARRVDDFGCRASFYAAVLEPAPSFLWRHRQRQPEPPT